MSLAGKMVMLSGPDCCRSADGTALDHFAESYADTQASSQPRNQDEWRSLFINAAKRGQS